MHHPGCVSNWTTTPLQRVKYFFERWNKPLWHRLLYKKGISNYHTHWHKTRNKTIPDSNETLYGDKQASWKTIMTHWMRQHHFLPPPLQTSMQNDDLKCVMDRPVQHQKTPKETLHQVRSYRYAWNDDTLEPGSNIPEYFITRYSHSIRGRTRRQ